MKKKLLLYVLLIPTMSFAQFSPTIQAYFDLGMDKYKNKFYGANLIGDYAFTKSVKAGIGVGIGGADILYFESSTGDSRDAATLMPFFADFQYKFNDEGIAPYLNLDAGYTLALSSNINNPGLFILPAFGVSFPLSKGAINLQIGYKYQKFEHDWFYISNATTGINAHYSNSGKENTSCNEIELSIGYTF
ncbi:MAG: hypothetical protein IKX24_06830 [Prevotella sp.]|nr:hypothetical protein [Prevotella sp.]